MLSGNFVEESGDPCRPAEITRNQYGLAAFADKLLSTLDANPVDTLVIDFRGNVGGDSSILDPLGHYPLRVTYDSLGRVLTEVRAPPRRRPRGGR